MNWLPELLNGLKDIAIVVFLGYGLKLMRQQNELLEREKALKQSEIDVHKARIERLESLQAPAIAHDLEQMTRTAEQYAQRKRELEKQVESLTAQSDEARKVVDSSYFIGIGTGSVEALALLKKFRTLAGSSNFLTGRGSVDDWLDGRSEDEYLLQEMDKGIRHLETITEQVTRGERPVLNAFKEWLESNSLK
jgi:hypothetical protein